MRPLQGRQNAPALPRFTQAGVDHRVLTLDTIIIAHQTPTLLVFGKKDAFAGVEFNDGLETVRLVYMCYMQIPMCMLLGLPPRHDMDCLGFIICCIIRVHRQVSELCTNTQRYSCLPSSLQVVPDLRVQYVEDASHWVQNDRPDVVNSTIRDFLARRGTGPCKLTSGTGLDEAHVEVVIRQ